MKNQIHIIIADDHQLFIEGLTSLLSDENHIVIDNIANDGKELLELLQKQKTDIVLLDINMPKMNGLDAIRYIKQKNATTRIIVLSTYNEEHLIEKARLLGANGYLLKNCNKEELVQTIQLIFAGHTSFPYETPKLHSDFDERDSFLKQFNLTKRESEIIQLIKNNFTNQQIADKLYLSIYTVETHRKNIMQKLGLSHPAALMKFIIENRI